MIPGSLPFSIIDWLVALPPDCTAEAMQRRNKERWEQEELRREQQHRRFSEGTGGEGGEEEAPEGTGTPEPKGKECTSSAAAAAAAAAGGGSSPEPSGDEAGAEGPPQKRRRLAEPQHSQRQQRQQQQQQQWQSHQQSQQEQQQDGAEEEEEEEEEGQLPDWLPAALRLEQDGAYREQVRCCVVPFTGAPAARRPATCPPCAPSPLPPVQVALQLPAACLTPLLLRMPCCATRPNNAMLCCAGPAGLRQARQQVCHHCSAPWTQSPRSHSGMQRWVGTMDGGRWVLGPGACFRTPPRPLLRCCQQPKQWEFSCPATA